MRRISEETRARIIDMYAHGKVHREIHEATGVSMGSISCICQAAGLDKYHVGGKCSRNIAMPAGLPKAAEKPTEPLIITSRTLTLQGAVTGCEYVAGTHLNSVDITLGDWMLSVERGKLQAFIDELQHIKTMIGA